VIPRVTEERVFEVGADLAAPTLIIMGISDWTSPMVYVFPAMGRLGIGFPGGLEASIAVQIFMDRHQPQGAGYSASCCATAIADSAGPPLSTMFAACVAAGESLDSVAAAPRAIHLWRSDAQESRRRSRRNLDKRSRMRTRRCFRRW